MRPDEGPLMIADRGGPAGIIGTAALTATMQRMPAPLQGVGLVEATPDSDGQEEPTESLAEKVAEGVLERPIGGATKRVGGGAIHRGYGADWGCCTAVRMPHWCTGRSSA